MLMTRGRGGTFHQAQAHFLDLQSRGPARVYYLEPIKSILVVAPVNVARAEEHFRELGIRVVTGHRYLGGFLDDTAAEREWPKEKVQWWTELVSVLAGVAHKYLQSAYAGLQKFLQQEWAFVQKVTPGVRGSIWPGRGGPPGNLCPSALQRLVGGTA